MHKNRNATIAVLVRENEQLKRQNDNLRWWHHDVQTCRGLSRNPRVMGLCGFFGYYEVAAPFIKRWADHRKSRLLKTFGNLCALDGASWRAVPGGLAGAMRRPFCAMNGKKFSLPWLGRR